MVQNMLTRSECNPCGKVTQIEVPWARPGSGFTLLMDALVLTLAKKLPVSTIAQMFGVLENRIWRAINVHVASARQATTYSEVNALGVDEKFVGRRLGYLTLFHDPLARRVIGTAEGRKADTFETFKADFVSHQGQPDAIEFITMDMSKAFQAGARKHFPKAEICFDAFHISQLIHDAVDEVRRVEVKQDASLKGSRWGLLTSPEDWSRAQINDMHWLQRSGLKTARAWRMKQRYKEIHLMCRAGADPEPLYRSWISWAKRSRLEPFKRLGKTLKSHLPGILAAYRFGTSNAVAENINSQIQAAIVRARGFKSLRSLTNIIFLTTGKLSNLPANPFLNPVPA
jgi:transposase